jgi:hypothetical protein
VRTARTIALVVLAVAAAALAAAAALVAALGWQLGSLAVVLLALVAVFGYQLGIAPWHARWGATDAEVLAPMPGDELLAHPRSTTRAIAIGAPAEAVWPWLVQLGWGRGGWYSYDWIDNDGIPSAERIEPALQHLEVGDLIAMTPELGYRVRAVEPGRLILSSTDDGSGTWCLLLEPDGPDRCRLVSRFRVDFPMTPATAMWLAVVGPGAFIMEREMLRNLRRRAERSGEPART